jgi:hypothetical protein
MAVSKDTRLVAVGLTALLGLLVAGCGGSSGPAPSPTQPVTGTVVGTVDGGCWGFLGPPKHWVVTVTATQAGKPKASTKITEVRSDINGGPYTMLGNAYRLELPAGNYQITASGIALHGLGGVAALGTVSVKPGQTVTNPKHMAPSC